MKKKIEQAKQLFNSGQFKKASTKLKKINNINKLKCVETLNLEAVCLLKLGNAEQVIPIINQALTYKVDHSEKITLSMNLCAALIKLQKVKLAKELLLTLLKTKEKNNSQVILLLCKICWDTDDFETIELFAPQLLSNNEYQLISLEYLCKTAIAMFNKKEAIKRLNNFASHIKNLTSAQLVFILDNLLSFDQIQSANKIFSNIPNEHRKEKWYQAIQSEIFIKEKKYQKIISLFAKDAEHIVNNNTVDNNDRILIKNIADAYAFKSDFKQAFKTYLKLGEVTKSQYRHFKKIDFLKSYQQINWNDLSFCNINSHKNEQLVFMYGFPRSGTTLLENVLDTHPDVQTMSEPFSIDGVITFLRAEKLNGLSYPAVLSSLNKQQVDKLRMVYYEEVNKVVDKNVMYKVLIDKSPLHAIHLPLINLLFPNAKHIINIRHPMDVILSNIQQTYEMNDEMVFLMTIDDCINRYLGVFDFMAAFHSAFKLSSIVIRYEDLITNLKQESNKVFDFLMVKQLINVENFHLHAQQKILNTSSKGQVIKPLYHSSAYKWLNYKDQLTEYLPLLNKYIKKYRYN